MEMSKRFITDYNHEMGTYEPPVLEVHVVEGNDRAVIVIKGLLCDRETPHAFNIDGWTRRVSFGWTK